MMRRGLLAVSLLLVGVFGAAVALPATTHAAPPSSCPSGKILTLKPWYDGLLDSSCAIKTPGSSKDEQRAFLWRIVLNIVEDLLQLVGYVTVGFIIYGGFQLMTSAGSPEQAAHAQKTIMHAAIGAVVAIASIGLVNLVARGLGL